MEPFYKRDKTFLVMGALGVGLGLAFIVNISITNHRFQNFARGLVKQTSGLVEFESFFFLGLCACVKWTTYKTAFKVKRVQISWFEKV